MFLLIISKEGREKLHYFAIFDIDTANKINLKGVVLAFMFVSLIWLIIGFSRAKLWLYAQCTKEKTSQKLHKNFTNPFSPIPSMIFTLTF